MGGAYIDMFMQQAMVISQMESEYPMMDALWDLFRKTDIRKDSDI